MPLLPPRARRSPPLPPAAVVLGALLLVAGCGEPDAPAGPAARPPPVRWSLPPIPAPQQARYALDRLLTGAAPHEALPLPLSHHDHSLRMAKQDLVLLHAETERLLSDPALIARVTDPQGGDSAWHGVLEVLAALPSPDPTLVLRWTAPAARAVHPTLQAAALVALSRLDHPDAAPLLLNLVVSGAEDRHNGRDAFSGLARFGPTWLGRGLQVLLTHGGAEAWLAVSGVLESAGAAAGAVAESSADLLAWWSLLAEHSGPRPSTNKPRLKSVPFAAMARDAHPASPGFVTGARGVRASGPWPGRLALDHGWLPADPSTQSLGSLYALWVVGKEPAADARCALALLGKSPYAAGVPAERKAQDSLLAARARHCMLPGERTLPTPARVARLEALLLELAAGTVPPIDDLREIARVLPSPLEDAGAAVLARVLEEARPAAELLWFLEQVFDLLASGGDDAEVGVVRRLLAAQGPEDRGLGLHLAHRSRNADLLPDLERVYAEASSEGRAALRRTLIWIYASGNTPPGALDRFIPRYATWVDEAPDATMAGLAAGLLDLGEAGAQALVVRLDGPRQAQLLEMLRGWPSVLPTRVAEALADRLSADLPADLRHLVLETLWRSAPAAAAGAIAAAKSRLDPSDRPAVDVVLDVVRHRAAHP